LLLKKRSLPLPVQRNVLRSAQTHWATWIDVPQTANEILRCRLHFSKSGIQRLKSFFYKDEQFWIYLKLINGEIHKYRIVPRNAEDGLWISPYFWRNGQPLQVEQIRFQASNSKYLHPHLSLSWETIEFTDAPNYASTFWGSDNLNQDSLLFESVHGFESESQPYWSQLTADRISPKAFAGSRAYDGTNTTYSCTFSLAADSLAPMPLRIVADAWIKAPRYGQSHSISLVISCKNDQGQYLYHSVNIDEQLIDDTTWNHVYATVNSEALKPNSSIGAYFWNREGKPLLVDDFRVQIRSSSPQ